MWPALRREPTRCLLQRVPSHRRRGPPPPPIVAARQQPRRWVSCHPGESPVRRDRRVFREFRRVLGTSGFRASAAEPVQDVPEAWGLPRRPTPGGRRRLLATFHDARTNSSSTSEKSWRAIEGRVRRLSLSAISEISPGGTIMNLSFDHGTPNAMGSTTSSVRPTSVTGTATTLRSNVAAAVTASSHAAGATPTIQRCP